MAKFSEIIAYLRGSGGGGGGGDSTPAPPPRKSDWGVVIPPVKDVAPPKVTPSKGESYSLIQSPIPTDRPSSRASQVDHPAGSAHRQNPQQYRNARATRSAEMPQRIPWWQRPFSQPQGQDRRGDYPVVQPRVRDMRRESRDRRDEGGGGWGGSGGGGGGGGRSDPPGPPPPGYKSW